MSNPTDMQHVEERRESVWFVVPAFNEASIIEKVLAEILERYPNVIVVNDGSTDGTGEIASATTALVISHAINLGQGAALQTGIRFAVNRGADYVVTFDADGQHNLDDVENMLEAIRSGHFEVALGSRFLGTTEDIPKSRRLFLGAAVIFTRITTGLKLTDTHNGLRVLTARAARSIELSQNGMAHASELLEQIARLDLSYIEVPVHIKYTPYSLKKGQSLGNSLRIVSDMIVQRMKK
jgi:polyprenyl-phospho-N-acetylgalactosaminyl synthase